MRISYLSLQISGLDEPLKYDPVIASIAWVENLMFLLAPNVMGINDKEDRSVRFLTVAWVEWARLISSTTPVIETLTRRPT